MSNHQDQGSGCATFIIVLLVIAGLFAAAISLAALVDPFAWMPPLDEVWAEDCHDKASTRLDECDLATRFPGFWAHTLTNLVYTLTAIGLLYVLYEHVRTLRESRPGRFDDESAAARYGEARENVAALALLSGLLAAVPIIVALV